MNNINFNNQINSFGNYKYNTQLNSSYTNFGTSNLKLQTLQQDGFQSSRNSNIAQPQKQGFFAGIKNFFSSPKTKKALAGLAIIATAVGVYLSSKDKDIKAPNSNSNTPKETPEKPVENNEKKPETSKTETETKTVTEEKEEIKETSKQPQTTKTEEKQEEQPIDKSLEDIKKEINQLVKTANETKIETVKASETKTETAEEVKPESAKETKAEQVAEKTVQEKKEKDTPKITELPNSKVTKSGKNYNITVNGNNNCATLNCHLNTITNLNEAEGYDCKKDSGMYEITGLYVNDVNSSGGGMGTAAIKQAVQLSKDLGQDGKVFLDASIINPKKGSPVPFYAKLGFKSFNPELQKEIEKGMKDLKETGVYTGPEHSIMYLPKDKAEELLSK